MSVLRFIPGRGLRSIRMRVVGSSIAVSCDMCHPHAANTHPETCPKSQAPLGRVALLREMIKGCIEHPVRGKVLSSDDPKMRALEAYILARVKASGSSTANTRHNRGFGGRRTG